MYPYSFTYSSREDGPSNKVPKLTQPWCKTIQFVWVIDCKLLKALLVIELKGWGLLIGEEPLTHAWSLKSTSYSRD